ncbi:MAG: hypothetical protein KAJ16_13620 [Calditrichia bacterium]|nr:hypothetical protein [Calditrichia bacterium]
MVLEVEDGLFPKASFRECPSVNAKSKAIINLKTTSHNPPPLEAVVSG